MPEEEPGQEEELTWSEDGKRILEDSHTPFRRAITEWVEGKRELVTAGSVLLRALAKAPTGMGRFRRDFDNHAVAPGEHGAPNEVLPISLKGIEELVANDPSMRDWLVAICWVLNYQYCSGFGNPKYVKHSRRLSDNLLRNHLAPAVARMCMDQPPAPSMDEVDRELQRKGRNYDGATYVEMEEVVPEKVVECWPQKGEAAVAPLEDFLEGPAKSQVLAPMESLLPKEEWPDKIPKSYVRASLGATSYRRCQAWALSGMPRE